jgi:hypothetical protein
MHQQRLYAVLGRRIEAGWQPFNKDGMGYRQWEGIKRRSPPIASTLQYQHSEDHHLSRCAGGMPQLSDLGQLC